MTISSYRPYYECFSPHPTVATVCPASGCYGCYCCYALVITNSRGRPLSKPRSLSLSRRRYISHLAAAIIAPLLGSPATSVPLAPALLRFMESSVFPGERVINLENEGGATHDPSQLWKVQLAQLWRCSRQCMLHLQTLYNLCMYKLVTRDY